MKSTMVAFLGALVVFLPAVSRGATLTSIEVTPANPAVAIGASAQMTATGTFSDASTRVLKPTNSIAGGGEHTCAAVTDGTVKCWGRNTFGQLGNGSTADFHTPMAVTGIGTAMSVAAGDGHTCVLLADGTARCWGSNLSGQLGNGTFSDSTLPVTVLLSTITSVAAGGEQTCALLSGGPLRCWGNNAYGQLGNGGTTNSSIPVAVTGIADAAAIAVGGRHACAVLLTGSVRCWGNNAYGQLGNGTTTDSSAPIAVTGITNATSIAAGMDHTCARLTDGTAKCWGRNNLGQLGDLTTVNRTTPVTVRESSFGTLYQVSALSAGREQTCALRAVSANGGSISCWGKGFGSTPQSVVSFTALGMGTGGDHVCPLLSGGLVRCRGSNAFGQLGNGTTTDSTTLVDVIGFGLPLVAPGDYHTCARLIDGTMRCWGYNFYGQLGNGTTTGATTPVVVGGIPSPARISAGRYHTCASFIEFVKCWGRNDYGQLGNGTTANSSTPVTVSGLSGVADIAAGQNHACALLTSGQIRCWGLNGSGQLGNGTTTNASTPVAVSGITNARSLAAGRDHTCAILSDTADTVKCWGLNGSGQLGNGTTTNATTPVTVSFSFTRHSTPYIEAGGEHTCVSYRVGAGGYVACWGLNNYGQLGDGTTTNSSTPVQVSGLSYSADFPVTAGGWHTCALLGSAARCWGYNGTGQLGNGTTTNSSTPVAVSGGSAFRSVGTGYGHTCGVMWADWSLKCWGWNGNGQLGNGTTTNASTPVAVAVEIGRVDTLLWSISDQTKALMDARGIVSALHSGTATITAGFMGVNGTTTLTVLGGDLSVSKADSPDPVTAGDPLTYTLTVTNHGPSPVSSVTLTDTLPSGVTFGSASAGCSSPSGGVVTCYVGALAVNAGATVTITVTPIVAGDLTNSASVTGSESDPDLSNNTATAVTKVRALLTVAKGGWGTGTVLSSPPGIDCGIDCTEIYDGGTVVTFSTTPGPNSAFSGWSGDPDCSDGSVTLSANRTCTANFSETIPPTGSVSINDGKAWTKTTAVTLTLSCADTGGSGCAQMQFSNDGVTFSPLEAFAASKAWTLTSGDGTKKVRVRFVDGDGNQSSIFFDSIKLDMTKPVVGGVSDAPDPFKHHLGEVSTIQFTVSDNMAGICKVEVKIFNDLNVLAKKIVKTGVSCPAGGAAASVVWDGRNTAGDLVPNGNYIYKVQAIDKALNRSLVRSGGTTAE